MAKVVKVIDSNKKVKQFVIDGIIFDCQDKEDKDRIINGVSELAKYNEVVVQKFREKISGLPHFIQVLDDAARDDNIVSIPEREEAISSYNNVFGVLFESNKRLVLGKVDDTYYDITGVDRQTSLCEEYCNGKKFNSYIEGEPVIAFGSYKHDPQVYYDTFFRACNGVKLQYDYDKDIYLGFADNSDYFGDTVVAGMDTKTIEFSEKPKRSGKKH